MLLPEGFDPRDLLPFGVHRYADRVRVLVDRLLVGSVLGAHRGGMVPLSVRSMEDLFGGSDAWSKVRASLLDRHIITTDDSYWNGPDPKTKWYRLLAPWTGVPTRTHTIRDARCARWLAQQVADRPAREGWLPVHHRLNDWLARTTVDTPAAEPILAAMKPDLRHVADTVVKIVNGPGRLPTVDRFGFRFHSPITAMPKALRAALRCDGMPLAEIDISACQPYLLGLLCLAYPVHPSSLHPNHWGEERGRRPDSSLPAYSLLRASSLYIYQENAPSVQAPIPADLDDFLTACSEDRYYETLAKRSRMRCRNHDERQKVKKFNCCLMYDVTRPDYRRWQSFAKRWPTVASRIELLKRGDYRQAAMELQRAESEIMIQGVCADLMRDHPEMPILTVHDCLLVPPAHAETARNAIRRRLDCFGYPVHLK